MEAFRSESYYESSLRCRLTGLITAEDGDRRLKKESILARFTSLIVIRLLLLGLATSEKAKNRQNRCDKCINLLSV